VNRDYSIAVHRMVKDYAVTTAASGPDLATAERLRDRLGFDVRYEGPAGSWTTSSELPTIDAVRAGAGPRTTTLFGHLLLVETGNYQIVEAPDGGAYLFSWTVGRRLNAVHLKLLALLAVFVLGVLLISYAVLRHLMRPLRTLGDGVARLGAGELDVVVPQRSRDEFGALTAAFNQMVRRVRDMIGARDQLLLDVSHELRSPLTRLKLDLEMLPESVQRARMGSDVVEMEAMLAELLELERLRDGRGMRPVRQDLLALVREVAGAYAERAPGVRVESNAERIPLDIDGDRIRTVLRNLFDNAVKYSLPDSKPIEVAVLDQGANVVVRVRDDGPGIPEADLQAIFEPFFRVDRSRAKATGGYGLGLSICRRIAEAHGGGIRVENNPGRGVTFTLQLSKPA
jgi:signal transduction histidine kinase